MKKIKKTATAETQNPNLEVELAKPGTPGELKVLEKAHTMRLPRFPRLDWLEAFRRWKGHKAGLPMLAARKAQAELTEGVSKDEPEEHFTQKGIIVVGTGGGEFGNPTKASWKESKAIKMGEKLGLKATTSVRKMNRTLTRLLEEEGGPTELSTIFRTLPHVVKREDIPGLYVYIGDAIQESDIERLSRRSDGEGLPEYYKTWKTHIAPQKEYKDQKVLATLDKLIEESIKREAKSHIELSYAARALERYGKKRGGKMKDLAGQLILDLISALYLSEVLYWQAIEICCKAERHRLLMTDRVGKKGLQDVERTAVFICDSNPNIARACRHESVDPIAFLLVQHPDAKNYGIYIDKELPKCHDCIDFWRGLQALELMEKDWSPKEISKIWLELADWKQHPELEGIWSSFMRDKKFYNGLGKEGFYPSDIPAEEIFILAQHAFDYKGGIQRWMWKKGIDVELIREMREAKRAAKAQPAPEVTPAKDAQTASAPASTVEETPTESAPTTDVAAAFQNAKPLKQKRTKNASLETKSDEKAQAAA